MSKTEQSNCIEHINVIDALAEQITALLDLMMGCDRSTDMRTIHTVSEMTATMFDGLIAEVKKLTESTKTLNDVIIGNVIYSLSEIQEGAYPLSEYIEQLKESIALKKEEK